ncbi:MAG: hypothetical protein ABIK89_23320 [Planctomycetota bacterium]
MDNKRPTNTERIATLERQIDLLANRTLAALAVIERAQALIQSGEATLARALEGLGEAVHTRMVCARVVSVLSDAGQPVVTLQGGAEGQQGLRVRDAWGKTVATLGLDADGGVLAICDHSGKALAGVQILDRAGVVTTRAADGEAQALGPKVHTEPRGE